jgi:hypothetical protein
LRYWVPEIVLTVTVPIFKLFALEYNDKQHRDMHTTRCRVMIKYISILNIQIISNIFLLKRAFLFAGAIHTNNLDNTDVRNKNVTNDLLLPKQKGFEAFRFKAFLFVVWAGIEPATHGFSVFENMVSCVSI